MFRRFFIALYQGVGMCPLCKATVKWTMNNGSVNCPSCHAAITIANNQIAGARKR